MAAGGTTLEYTPTWVVALVCSVIVGISFGVERAIHYIGKYFKRTDQKPLYEALQKIKEELMLLGFISLLLTVFQDRINTICIAERFSKRWLPCKLKKTDSSTTAHFLAFTSSTFGQNRRLLADDPSSTSTSSYSNKSTCPSGQVPILSTTALHHLHIFIFVLAVAHVTVCALTIIFGGAKIRQWKRWEEEIHKELVDNENEKTKFRHVKDYAFIKGRFFGIGKNVYLLGWVHSFIKQFYGSVTKADYITLRFGFIKTHCKGNPKFDFHKYMIRALEADFKRVVGISWYLWVSVFVFLLLNFSGWHAYFYISFVPFVLLITVGTKLEHVINQLAHEVAEKHIAIEGDIVVQPSDDHFWFHRPKIVLIIIHIILFQNAFELAFFFFVLLQYQWESCMMGEVVYVIPRLAIGAFVQFLCSYSTLPLYAIVTQMGTSFKSAIFEENIQQGISVWAKHAKKTTNMKKAIVNGKGSSHTDTTQAAGSSSSVAPDTVTVHVKETSSEIESQVEMRVVKQEDRASSI